MGAAVETPHFTYQLKVIHSTGVCKGANARRVHTARGHSTAQHRRQTRSTTTITTTYVCSSSRSQVFSCSIFLCFVVFLFVILCLIFFIFSLLHLSFHASALTRGYLVGLFSCFGTCFLLFSLNIDLSSVLF